MAAPPQDPNHVKGPWSPEEDEQLRRAVEEMGPKNWSAIAAQIPHRTGKSCRLRWFNQLSPAINPEPFTPEEDAAIISAHAQYGNKWAHIAQKLTGRTDNQVKNHWNSMLSRRGFTVNCSSDYNVTVVDLNTTSPFPPGGSSGNSGFDQAQGYRPDLNVAWNFIPSASAPPQQAPPQPQFLPYVPAPPEQTQPLPQFLPSFPAPPPQRHPQPQFLPSFPAPPPQTPRQPQFRPSFPNPPPQTPQHPQFLPSTTAPPPQTPPQPLFAPPMGTGSVGQIVQELFHMPLTTESAQGLMFSALIEEIRMRIEDDMKQNGITGINYDPNQIEDMASKVMSLLGINGVHP